MWLSSNFLPFLLVIVLQIYPGQSQETFYGRPVVYISTPKTTFEAFVDCRARDLNMMTFTTYDEFIRILGHAKSLNPAGVLVSPIIENGFGRRWLATGEVDKVFYAKEPLTCFHLHPRGLVNMDCNEKFPYFCV